MDKASKLFSRLFVLVNNFFFFLLDINKTREYSFRLANKTHPCDPTNDEYRCQTGECISTQLLCDSKSNSTNFLLMFLSSSDVQHCLDGSDESPRYSCISSKLCLTFFSCFFIILVSLRSCRTIEHRQYSNDNHSSTTETSAMAWCCHRRFFTNYYYRFCSVYDLFSLSSFNQSISAVNQW